MNPLDLAALRFESKLYLNLFQELNSLPRETLPQSTAAAAAAALSSAAARLDLEFIETKGVAPTFLLLPRGTAGPSITLFGSWHAESHPSGPAAVDGSERVALTAAVGALSALVGAGLESPAVVVPPGATQGSLVLDEQLRLHRERLAAPVAFWPRISPVAPRRRRVFLGARGRVIFGIWGQGTNPYPIRDQIVAQLSEDAYGPRPLDFELLRKLAQSEGSSEFLARVLDDPEAVSGEGESRFQNALFEPHGRVLAPPIRHPDRPQAWLTIETAESMEPSDVARRVQSLAGEAKTEMVEAFHWDRLNIHHAAAQSAIRTAKSRSEGAEIWPLAPWVTPSGLFSRALGTPLAEWSVPLPPGMAIRFPKLDQLEEIERELAELFLRSLGLLKKEPQEA